MQLSEIDRQIIANVHSLPLNEQQAFLEYSAVGCISDSVMHQKFHNDTICMFLIKT